jgi:flagellar motor protein MotB
VYFAPYSAELDSSQHLRLWAIAAEMIGKPQQVQVLCHTSRAPLPAELAALDHWDLCYRRGRVVMQRLAELGIDPGRMRLALAAGNEPARRLDDPHAVDRDSRVEIYFLDALAESARGAGDEQIEAVDETDDVAAE